jgi:hypothetical protein
MDGGTGQLEIFPHSQRKELALACKAAPTGAPDDSDLARIRSYTLRDFGADELYVRTFVVAHNAIDRDNECFDEGFLDTLARTLPGKGCFEKHPMSYDGDTGMPEGLWFNAYTERMPQSDARKVLRTPDLAFPPDRADAVLLMASMFMPVMDENKATRMKLDAGMGFVSVGFSTDTRTPIRDSGGRELTATRLGASGKGEALEASLVWLGAQPGARAVKSATQPSKGNPMDLQIKLDAANTEITNLKAAASAAQAKAARLDEIETAFGDQKGLLANVPALLASVADAKSYREHLVDEVVTAQRVAGMIKADKPEDLAQLKTAYAGMPVAQLKTLADNLPSTKGHARIPGSDPNAPTGTLPASGGDAKTPALIGGAFGVA